MQSLITVFLLFNFQMDVASFRPQLSPFHELRFGHEDGKQRGISPGRIKTLLLRRKNDCFSAKFGVLRQPLRLAAMGGHNRKRENAAIEKLTKIFFYCAFLLRR